MVECDSKGALPSKFININPGVNIIEIEPKCTGRSKYFSLPHFLQKETSYDLRDPLNKQLNLSKIILSSVYNYTYNTEEKQSSNFDKLPLLPEIETKDIRDVLNQLYDKNGFTLFDHKIQSNVTTLCIIIVLLIVSVTVVIVIFCWFKRQKLNIRRKGDAYVRKDKCKVIHEREQGCGEVIECLTTDADAVAVRDEEEHERVVLRVVTQ